MNWQDEAYLLSKIKFRENANIISVFSNSFGKVSGIVYGGNSRKIKNYLQISNKIYIFYNSKNNNRVGYFKTELLEPISPKFFNNKQKTSALLSITSILNALLPESQPYKNLYTSINELILNFDNNNWINCYINWELNLIKELGYDANLQQFKNKNLDTNEMREIKIDDIKYMVPVFLINQESVEKNNKLLNKALNFTRSILLNKFFLPNNIIFPRSRVQLENYFI
jgi:DNA repair protein RecO (recombination protein O)